MSDQINEAITPTDSAPKAGARLGGVGLILMGVAAFIAFASLISFGFARFNGEPYMAVLTEKKADYVSERDQYDVVFIGSSQTFRHIHAPRINQSLEKGGGDARVYNFGVPALTEPEMRYILDHVLENRSDRLSTVVLQNPLRAEGVFSNMMTNRGRYFRAVDHVGETFHDVQCYTGSTMGKLKRYKENAMAVTAEQFALGRMAETVFPDPNAKELVYDAGYRKHSGFYPVDQDMNIHVLTRKKKFAMKEKDMVRFLSGSADFIPSEAAADCRARQLLESIDKIRAAGLTPAYFVSPNPKETGHDRAIADALHRLAPDVMLIDFADPDLHADLFKWDLWFDHSHMNERGAALLADKIAQMLKEELGSAKMAISAARPTVASNSAQ